MTNPANKQPSAPNADFMPNWELYTKMWERHISGNSLPWPVTIKKAGHKGLGVFTTKFIKKHYPIEICYCIRMRFRRRYVSDPGIMQYSYWDSNCKCEECSKHGANGFVALGNGSVYNCVNPGETPNCSHLLMPREGLLVYVAMRDIKKGEELLTWWGDAYYNSWCRSPESRPEELTK